MKYRFFDKIILTGSSKPVNPSNNKYLRTWVFGWLSKTGLTQKDWASIFYKQTRPMPYYILLACFHFSVLTRLIKLQVIIIKR